MKPYTNALMGALREMEELKQQRKPITVARQKASPLEVQKNRQLDVEERWLLERLPERVRGVAENDMLTTFHPDDLPQFLKENPIQGLHDSIEYQQRLHAKVQSVLGERYDLSHFEMHRLVLRLAELKKRGRLQDWRQEIDAHFEEKWPTQK
ncbi:MAG: hypothetical protein V1708_04130 [Candidatus Micrarchaeota archaeon]